MLRRIISIAWVLALFGLLFWLYTENGQSLQDAISDYPVGGLWIGFVLIVASQVLAPLSGFPVFAILAKSYGLSTAVMILYAAYVVSSTVNFWIARRYGMPIVARIIGEAGIERAIGWLNSRSILYIGLSRVLGYYYHDIISYAWGLTKVKFWPYFSTTLIVTLLPLAAEYAVLSRIELDDVRGLLVFYGAMLAISVIFVGAWLIFQRIREKGRAASS
jgi:uncharacterized membrane protein YdjX (TVP38/TMEM64 family)